MDQATQERPRGQNHSCGTKGASIGQPNAGDGPIDKKVIHLAFDHRQIGRAPNGDLHGCGIELSVGLGTGAAHRRPFPAVEQTKLNAAGIRNPAHETVEGVDLAHEMAFAETSDRRIA